MLVLESSTQFIFYPWNGPSTLTQEQVEALPVYTAIVPDGSDEPDTSAYQASAWIGHEVAHLKEAGSLTAGIYMVYGRIVSAGTGEDVRLPCGRLHVGWERT